MPRFRVSRKWFISGTVVAAALAALVLTLPITLTPGLRTRLTAALAERFDSEVDLETLRVAVLPRVRVSGSGVVFRHGGRRDVPPLITVASFSAEAGLLGLLGQPLRLKRVHLDRLEINVPPGGMRVGRDDSSPSGAPAGGVGDGAQPEGEGARQDDIPDEPGTPAERAPVIVDELLTERAVLRILRGDPAKEPRLFEIHHLSMRGAGSHEPWAFSATLTNPTPPGRIETHGTFGPWNGPEPARTPLDAEYEFRDADLGVFDGIRGTLTSTGAFAGVLERIEVHGRADVADFALDDVGTPVPLETRFTSLVDATNGNTWLKPVHATLAQSAIVANGGVVEREGEDGRTVELDIVMKDARIGDVLRLAVRAAAPPMTGVLGLTTKFVLPPGPGDAVQKMRLDGSFQIARARFTAGGVQGKLNELSQKARADDDDDDEGPADQVVSDMSGRFVMSGGVIRFSNVRFMVPGARVEVGGRYTFRGEALDFRGTVSLEAKLSQLTTGVKSFFLRAVDPLVRRKGQTVIPITIGGTVSEPKVGLDVRRTLTGN